MSALWLEFTLILCIYGTTWTAADVEGVVRRNVGESITIQCNSNSKQDSLSLKMGLDEEQDVFYTATHSGKATINGRFADRLQHHDKFPKVEILIKNLTVNDTGPYWCVYKMTDEKFTPRTTRGSGSVLLVVTEKTATTTNARVDCHSSQENMILVSVVISAAVLIVVLVIFFIWIIFRKKPLHNTVKPRQVPTNDVYEDMRGTIRR